MGIAGKSRRRAARKQKRQAEKAARKAQYAAFAEKGDNSKRKNKSQNKGVRLVKNTDHPLGKCGNIGCSKCNASAARDTHRRAA
jgi:hypothetical protein